MKPSPCPHTPPQPPIPPCSSQVACGGCEGGDAPEGSDLLRPEYCTDDFRMYAFKIDCCPRLAESHDWTQCPFQHPGARSAGLLRGARQAQAAGL